MMENVTAQYFSLFKIVDWWSRDLEVNDVVVLMTMDIFEFERSWFEWTLIDAWDLVTAQLFALFQIDDSFFCEGKVILFRCLNFRCKKFGQFALVQIFTIS